MPGSGINSAISESALREFEERERRVEHYCAVVAAELHLQLAVRQITTVDELTAFSRRQRVPIDHLEIALFYRYFDQPFWPWYAKPKQVRRYFAHLGCLPAAF
jgi:hypothetical protein